MSTDTHRAALARLRPSRQTLQWAVPLLAVELFAILAYAARPDVTILTPVYLLVPFVWINAALLAVIRTPLGAETRRERALAAGVGLGYLLVLALVGGMLSIGADPPAYVRTGLWVSSSLPPGYAPTVHLVTDGLRVSVLPYQFVGYATLAYLVAAKVLAVSRFALSGLLGLFSCVSCTWPVVGSVLAATVGGSSAIATIATQEAYLVSTAVFCSALLLLTWRPSIGRD